MVGLCPTAKKRMELLDRQLSIVVFTMHMKLSVVAVFDHRRYVAVNQITMSLSSSIAVPIDNSRKPS